jgi:uncharacterized paraquat-inducible protein A
MKTQCPNCSKPIEVPDIYEGREIKCESCKKTYTAKPQPIIIINANTTPQPPPQQKTAEELLSLPSSTFPLVMSILCGITAFFLFIAAIISSLSVTKENNAGELFAAFWIDWLTAALFYSLAAIIDAINANTKRKK